MVKIYAWHSVDQENVMEVTPRGTQEIIVRIHERFPDWLEYKDYDYDCTFKETVDYLTFMERYKENADGWHYVFSDTEWKKFLTSI